MVRIPEGSAPDIKNKSFKITADLIIPAEGAEGVLATQGGRFSGWGLYVLKGRPVFHYNLIGAYRSQIEGPEVLSPGKHTVSIDFQYDGPGAGKGGTAVMTVDGNNVAEGTIARTVPVRISVDETLDFGEDTGTAVSEDYQVPFRFTGKLNDVTIELGNTPLTQSEQKELQKARASMVLTH